MILKMCFGTLCTVGVTLLQSQCFTNFRGLDEPVTNMLTMPVSFGCLGDSSCVWRDGHCDVAPPPVTWNLRGFDCPALSADDLQDFRMSSACVIASSLPAPRICWRWRCRAPCALVPLPRVLLALSPAASGCPSLPPLQLGIFLRPQKVLLGENS